MLALILIWMDRNVHIERAEGPQQHQQGPVEYPFVLSEYTQA